MGDTADIVKNARAMAEARVARIGGLAKRQDKILGLLTQLAEEHRAYADEYHNVTKDWSKPELTSIGLLSPEKISRMTKSPGGHDAADAKATTKNTPRSEATTTARRPAPM